jgi:hypothetical protein
MLNTIYYPVLYYNSEIWLTPSLQTGPNQQLVSASANALCTCMYYPSPYISFNDIHKQLKKSTPKHFALYKISLVLYKLFNCTVLGTDWEDLKLNIVTTSWQPTFDTNRLNNYKIGTNTLSNKLVHIRKRILLDHLNLPYPAFKHKMKNIFLPYEFWFGSCLLYPPSVFVSLLCSKTKPPLVLHFYVLT